MIDQAAQLQPVQAIELAGGQVLVGLPHQRRVVLLDSNLTNIRIIADSMAPSPIRYSVRQQSPIIPYLGDSVLVPDFDARSLVVIEPTGRVGRAIASPSPKDYNRITQSAGGGAKGVDQKGRLLYIIDPPPPPWTDPNPPCSPNAKPPAPLELAPIVRADFETHAVDTIAQLTTRVLRFSMCPVINPMMPAVDDWAVLADGTVAIVRGADYHIDWIYADGSTGSTPKMPFAWLRISDSDKQAKLDSARRIIDSLRASGVDPYEQHNATPRLGAVVQHPQLKYALPEQMADYLPPIRVGSALPDADGHLWILPTSALGSDGGLLYDVVDTKGLILCRVQLPHDRIVAGFGRGGVVYMTALESGSRWSLERARMASGHAIC